MKTSEEIEELNAVKIQNMDWKDGILGDKYLDKVLFNAVEISGRLASRIRKSQLEKNFISELFSNEPDFDIVADSMYLCEIITALNERIRKINAIFVHAAETGRAPSWISFRKVMKINNQNNQNE